MAPVGNNGPYIPRLDPEIPRKRSLAMQNVTPTALSDITNQAVNNAKRQRVGGGNSSGVGSSSGVQNDPAPTGNVATDPFGRKSPTPDRDTISVNSIVVRNRMEANRVKGTVPADPQVTGDFTQHPTTEFIAAGKLWMNANENAKADARIEVSASGLYNLTGALQTQVPVATPAAPRKRSFGMVLSQ